MLNSILSIPLKHIKKLEFFQALAPGSKEKLLGQISLITFELGQQIAAPGVISGRVLILLQGQVRLIVDDQEGLHSFGKFEVGSVLGAASLLCGVGLDNLIASSSVLAASISDELWAEYYANDASFRSWCDNQLWPSEIIHVCKSIQQCFYKDSLDYIFDFVYNFVGTCHYIVQEVISNGLVVKIGV